MKRVASSKLEWFLDFSFLIVIAIVRMPSRVMLWVPVFAIMIGITIVDDIWPVDAPKPHDESTGQADYPHRCMRCGDVIDVVGPTMFAITHGREFCSATCFEGHKSDPSGDVRVTPVTRCTLCGDIIRHKIAYDPDTYADGTYCRWRCAKRHTKQLNESGQSLSTGARPPKSIGPITYDMASRGAREMHAERHPDGRDRICDRCGKYTDCFLWGHRHGGEGKYCYIDCMEAALGREVENWSY